MPFAPVVIGIIALSPYMYIHVSEYLQGNNTLYLIFVCLHRPCGVAQPSWHPLSSSEAPGHCIATATDSQTLAYGQDDRGNQQTHSYKEK